MFSRSRTFVKKKSRFEKLTILNAYLLLKGGAFLYVIHDEVEGNIKLIEEMFDEVIFEVSVYADCEVNVMIDFFLLYASIVSLS